ncbi:ribose ABC transporter ATP-binding protein [Bacillus mycoides]|uniref:ribose ABC transporter ATP-binding protein n=1 Tax=Bacillus mycoides TaxID=1405 RepID=UPI001F13F655|nr:ribose ABC transporter ATP-binding protein [Bacillus mycoides]
MNPKSVGAAISSSKFLEDKMIEEIDLKKVYYIVEYGPSTGVFTEKLIKRRRELINCIWISSKY